MKQIILLFLLSIIGLPALADTYVCEQEQVSYMELSLDIVGDFRAGPSPQVSYVVNGKGVKSLDGGSVLFESCKPNEKNALFLCERNVPQTTANSPEILSSFRINKGGGFSYVSHVYDLAWAQESHAIFMGKCHKIES